MPIRAANRIVKILSNQYYEYGKLVASRTNLLLLFSLSFISFFSIPLVSKYFSDVVAPTLHNNIPSTHIATSLDAQCWHASAHVQFNNFSLSRNSPTNYLLTEQIRISRPDESVNYELIQLAKQIYESITTTMVTVSSSSAPVSLATICYKHHGHCLIHAPPFMAFQNELDWTLNTKLDNSDHSYETHPYSVYSNATFDQQGKFIKADAVLLTFVLNQTQQSGDTLTIWNKILQEVKSKFDVLDVQQHHDRDGILWSSLSNTVPHMIQYKFNLFPYDIPYNVQFSIVAYIIAFFLVSMAFGKSNLVKSGYTFGLAAVFLTIACFTTTWGIFDKLGISFHSVPWYLLLLVVNIGCLENIFLLTNAVLYAGCDMIVKEKISRGLQSVGVPMTATLIAELLILTVGTHMDTDLVKEFCTFAKVALIVDYVLELTFVIAVLSIDIKRVELADLDDRQMSKRLHELASFDHDKERIQSDFCPIQDTANKEDAKSCAECKEFKTHRVFCAFMLCLIVLLLSLFVSKDHYRHNHSSRLASVPSALMTPEKFLPDLNQLSDQFWSTVNPQKDITWLQIQPPELFIVDNDIHRVQQHLDFLQQLYQVKSKAIHYKTEYRPSRFRRFVLSLLQSLLVFVLSINIPILILCLVMIGIITWMTPKWRKQWLVPLLIHCFNQFFLYLIRCYPTQYLKRMYFTWVKGPTSEGGIKEYDADGIHHRGAITVQNIFNQQQYRANVKTVQVRTLINQHIADIQNLDSNAKQSLVSCGQDGRIVLWNVDSKKATWMARLDKLYPSRGGMLQSLLNPIFYPSNSSKKKGLGRKSLRQQHQQQQESQQQQQLQRPISLSKNYLSKARLVKIDQGNKWVAAACDDGLIRVWNVSNGTLVREMDVHPQMPSVEVHEEQSHNSTMRNRLNGNLSESNSPTLSYSSFVFSTASSNATLPSGHGARKKPVDRILCIAFIGVITEFCHPLVAEAAARCRSSTSPDVEASQNYLVSAHKSGNLHEWNILSGECVQTIKTGHTKDIIQVHVVDSKAPHRKLGVTWVFTASKDGTVKCWDRRFIAFSSMTQDQADGMDHHQPAKWTLVYTIKLNSPVTCIATEQPVGGMGVLVTGCSDGSVKVWNFETGESVCALSLGKMTSASFQSMSSAASVASDFSVGNAGGPIRKFSKFSTHMSSHDVSDSSDDDDSSDSSLSSLSRHTASDHRGAIYQVVVTRYCEVENGPGLCRGCDTCFGNGFLIASSAMDNKVHAWRLERSDNGHEGSCTLCTKDYHRKQYKHRKSSISNSDDGASDILLHKSATTNRRRRSSQQGGHSPTVKKRHVTARAPIAAVVSNNSNAFKDDLLELLDIEQLAGDAYIPLKPTFLGKIDQPAGRDIVFCDKILAGVRRHRISSLHNNDRSQKKHGNGEWEAWFASLQYYDPSVSKEDGNVSTMKIPIETFNLDDDQQNTALAPLADKDEDSQKATQVLRGTLLGLFTSSPSSAGSNHGVATASAAHVKDQLRYKGIHAHINEQDDDAKNFDDENDDLEEENLEASENLPFSAVRHVIPLDGAGLACDFGNFIKLVYLDKPTLTEKERAKQTRDTMEDHKRRQTIVDQVVVEEDEIEDASNCQCSSNDGGASCSPANKGKDGCCGGVNKEKNGGKCCGGAGASVKKKQQEKRQQKLLLKKQTLSFDSNNTCGGIRSIAECSLKNNCSRAADCASSNQALAANASTSSFSNWL